MGDDKISPSGFLTVAYFYHLGCVSLPSDLLRNKPELYLKRHLLFAALSFLSFLLVLSRLGRVIAESVFRLLFAQG